MVFSGNGTKEFVRQCFSQKIQEIIFFEIRPDF